jgi:transcriptional regulator with XRE-family HTH domain
LIRNARLVARKSLDKYALLAGLEIDVLRSWEDGLSAPSLLELEALANTLHRPLHYFWGERAKTVDVPLTESMNLPAQIRIRQRMVGALLRQQRKNANLSLAALSEQSGISRTRLNGYEMGEHPIPLPFLEGLLTLCGGQIEALFDQKGPIGQWMNQQNTAQDYEKLPTELQKFVTSRGAVLTWNWHGS